MHVATINLKLFFPQRIHFSRFTPIFQDFNKIIKFQYFSRTGKTVVIFPGFPGAVGTLDLLISPTVTQFKVKVGMLNSQISEYIFTTLGIFPRFRIHSVPHNSNSLVSNYLLFRRPLSTPKISPLTQC